MLDAKQDMGFLIGMPVQIHEDAKPIGWGDDEVSLSVSYTRGNRGNVADVAVEDDGTISFEVLGWYWLPEDLDLA